MDWTSSCWPTPFAKSRVASTICCISSLDVTKDARVSSSSTISARTRRAVRGDRRSCASAASIWVRSLTKRVRRSCIVLNAWVRSCTSFGPTTGKSPSPAPRPKRSDAFARLLSGPVNLERRNQKLATNRRPAVTANDMLEARDHCSGGLSNRVPTLSQLPPANAIESSISMAARLPCIISACISAISGDRFGSGSRPPSIS